MRRRILVATLPVTGVIPRWKSYAAVTWDSGPWSATLANTYQSSYRDWQTRAHRARFDCSKAKRVLGWDPAADRGRVVEEGIRRPAAEWLA